MAIDRRTLLVVSAALTGLSVLGGEAAAQGEGKSEVPGGAVTLTASVRTAALFPSASALPVATASGRELVPVSS